MPGAYDDANEDKGMCKRDCISRNIRERAVTDRTVTRVRQYATMDDGLGRYRHVLEQAIQIHSRYPYNIPPFPLRNIKRFHRVSHSLSGHTQ